MTRSKEKKSGNGKSYGQKTVLEAANERLAIIFRDFEQVLVAFSCGKDSGVVLSLAYKYAKENNLLHKFSFYYEDYEADYRYTHEYAERIFTGMNDVAHRYWLCLPISAACAVSMHQPSWIPWDKDKQDIWVRPMPEGEYVVNEDNAPFPFTKGTKGFDTRIYFSKWFARQYGKTAVLIGIRADESLTRLSIFTSQHRKNMHKGLRYSTKVDELTMSFYPIYDWKTQDIWVANYKFGFDYNKIYDLYYQAGLSVDEMRVASPFHQCGQENLRLYKVIDPNTWGKMVSRVNGVNFTGIYGGTTAMGWRNIKKPAHFTWKQYAEFLMTTLPEETKKKFLYHLTRLQKTWADRGYGRNPEVIRKMVEQGVEIENTKVICKKCLKPGVYEIIRIKSGFPDEIEIGDDFRHCPSWKAVCITILKNDFICQYMGCSRPADKNILKLKGLEKYANLRTLKQANDEESKTNENN